MTQHGFRIEAGFDFFFGEIFLDIRIHFHVGLKISAFKPAGHSVALHPFISVFTQHALADQCDQQILAEDQAAGLVQVRHHRFRINQQLVDDAGKFTQHMIQRDSSIR